MKNWIPVRPISVIIPVYNGTQFFKKLIESLEQTYPKAEKYLKFIFLDDGSTDADLHSFYENEFFKRPDVVLKKRGVNHGFIKTANEAIGLAEGGADLVLLNSDTQVWTRSFEKLQQVSLRHPRSGSITPLTNQGTIASLFQWPYGLESDFGFTPKEIAEAVAFLDVPTPHFSAPTGVGFCLYIPRRVWEIVGELSTVFGKGYGEECDWCQRAMRVGFEHLICTETYVHHTGTASFSSEEKKHLTEANGKLLEKRNPGYNAQVVRYVGQRPLAMECLFVLAQLICQKSRKLNPASKVFLFALHADPWNEAGGGAEKHAKRLIDLLHSEHPVFCIYWMGRNSFELKLVFQDFIFIQEVIHVDLASKLLRVLGSWISVLHVHHVMDWPQDVVDVLVDLPIAKKLLTVHDYFFLCPSVNLLKGRTIFCGVEKNLEVCNQCLKQTYGYWSLRIESYRYRCYAVLLKMDQIILPSPVILDYFKAAFSQQEFEGIAPKLQVLGHDLSYISEHFQTGGLEKQPGRKIAFIGHYALHKGSEVIAEALDGLVSRGFTLEIWGSYYSARSSKKVLAQVKVIPFKEVKALAKLFQQRQPDFVAIPSLSAETFSYVFYEALILGKVPVVVGPFGNPAAITQKEKLGSVMITADGAGLIAACEDLVTRYAELLNQARRFSEKLFRDQHPYLLSYLKILESGENQEFFKEQSLSSFPREYNLSQWNQNALAQEKGMIKGVKVLQTHLERLPHFQRIERRVFLMLRVLWRTLRGLRQKVRVWISS